MDLNSKIYLDSYEGFPVIAHRCIGVDWFCFFINIHDGFPKIRNYKLLKDKTIANQGRAIVPYDYTNDTEDKSFEKQDFMYLVDKGQEMGIYDHSKVVFRYNPDTFLDTVYNRWDDCHPQSKIEIKHHITLHCSNKTHEDRLEFLAFENNHKWSRSNLLNPIEDIQTRYDEYILYREKFAEHNADLHLIDIGKLLFEQDVVEYYKLCKIIKSNPLYNWQEKIQHFYEDLFKDQEDF